MKFDPSAHGWHARDSMGFNALIGPLWTRHDGGANALGLIVEEKHLNRRGHIHGGVLASFADNLLARVSAAAVDPKPIATMQLNVHFVAPAHLHEFLEGQGEVVRATRSVVFVAGRLLVGKRIVAAVDGIWKILQPREASAGDGPAGPGAPDAVV